MSILALGLIVISAFMHATWNYLAKQSKSGFSFVWLYTLIGTIVYIPAVAVVLKVQDVSFGWMEAAFILGSALIHIAYALTLQKGYKIGDFSLVYPVARGTGPMIVAIAAVFIYDEHLTTLGTIGVVFIIGSIFVITGGFQAIRDAKTLVPLLYGLLIGLFISGYTLLDKGAVSVMLISPIILNYGSNLMQLIILGPIAKRRWGDIRHDWKYHRKEAIGVGILSPLAYILVLTAMSFTQVSHVAPVREISILIGTMIGTRILKEGFGTRRIIAASTMVIGVIAVALSGG